MCTSPRCLPCSDVAMWRNYVNVFCLAFDLIGSYPLNSETGGTTGSLYRVQPAVSGNFLTPRSGEGHAIYIVQPRRSRQRRPAWRSQWASWNVISVTFTRYLTYLTGAGRACLCGFSIATHAQKTWTCKQGISTPSPSHILSLFLNISNAAFSAR